MSHYKNFRIAIEKEIESLNYFLSNIEEDVVQKIIRAILNIKGKVVFTGIGKSGIVGAKIAATFASTGTESVFIHSTEAFHGDLGMINNNDILILISFSGKTDEVVKVLKYGKDNKIPIISITGNPNSILAKNSDYHITCYIEEEACPLKLAPTSSTTVTLAIGDALAIALMKAKGFKEKDFAKYHPGGNLGKRLLYNVNHIMRKNDLPFVGASDSIRTIVSTIHKGNLGITVVLEENKILGVISDGDIRRAMESKESTFFELKAEDIMTRNPKCIYINENIELAGKVMYENKIGCLLVINQNKELSGIIQSYDLEIF